MARQRLLRQNVRSVGNVIQLMLMLFTVYNASGLDSTAIYTFLGIFGVERLVNFIKDCIN